MNMFMYAALLVKGRSRIIMEWLSQMKADIDNGELNEPSSLTFRIRKDRISP